MKLMKYRTRLLTGFITLVVLLTVNCSADSGKFSESSNGEKEVKNRPEPVFPHPEFEISLGNLMEKIQSEPDSVRKNIQARPEYFLELSRQFLELPEWARLLVDR